MGGTVRYSHRVQGLIALAIAVMALGIIAGPARAASTRAEYVAQVDQACTSFAPKFASLDRPLKQLTAQLNKVVTETDAQEKRRFNRIFRGLGRYIGKTASLFGEMAEQVALVGPAPGDEAAVAQWIEGLRQFAALQAQSVPAWRHRKLGRAAALSQRSLEALNNGGAAVAAFGISDCPTHIDVPETSYG
jgi:hypothetical protein